MLRTGLMLLLLCAVGTASAVSLYKWVDDKGVTHYSEEPPIEGKASTMNIDVPPAGAAAPAAPGVTPTAKTSSKSVVIYTATWCGVCKQAKQYMRSHNIAFSEYDVETSAKGEADYRRMNGRGVPILLVGETRMNGFSADRLEELLRK